MMEAVSVWEFRDIDVWVPHSPENSVKLEKAYKNHVTSFWLDYEIKVTLQRDNWFQSHIIIGPVEPIRRRLFAVDSVAGLGVSWCWMDNTKRKKYSMDVQCVLEDLNSMGLEDVSLGLHFIQFPYTVDFKSMTQRNTNTGFTTTVKRWNEREKYPRVKLQTDETLTQIPDASVFVTQGEIDRAKKKTSFSSLTNPDEGKSAKVASSEGSSSKDNVTDGGVSSQPSDRSGEASSQPSDSSWEASSQPSNRSREASSQPFYRSGEASSQTSFVNGFSSAQQRFTAPLSQQGPLAGFNGPSLEESNARSMGLPWPEIHHQRRASMQQEVGAREMGPAQHGSNPRWNSPVQQGYNARWRGPIHPGSDPRWKQPTQQESSAPGMGPTQQGSNLRWKPPIEQKSIVPGINSTQQSFNPRWKPPMQQKSSAPGMGPTQQGSNLRWKPPMQHESSVPWMGPTQQGSNPQQEQDFEAMKLQSINQGSYMATSSVVTNGERAKPLMKSPMSTAALLCRLNFIKETLKDMEQFDNSSSDGASGGASLDFIKSYSDDSRDSASPSEDSLAFQFKTDSSDLGRLLRRHGDFVNLSNDSKESCCICCELLQTESPYGRQSNAAIKLKCSHVLHVDCIRESSKSSSSASSIMCPICKTVHGTTQGTQPKGGQMSDRVLQAKLPGFSCETTIQITYNFESGVQGPEHPHPGRPYKTVGFPRIAYLPNNPRGQKVLALLKKAFERRLIFTVGESATFGAKDVVTWNDIHHKTSMGGGSSNYGYPDDTYLDRVTEELQAHGIE